jgi:hypothetical protein
MTNIGRRQSVAPRGTFVAAQITLGAYTKAEEAQFDIESDDSGARIYHAGPDPDGALARAAEEALRAHEAAMVAWIEIDATAESCQLLHKDLRSGPGCRDCFTKSQGVLAGRKEMSSDSDRHHTNLRFAR